MYEYRARLLRVVDGDTFDFQVDLGFGIKFQERFRLFGADTPEIYGKHATENGKIAKEAVEKIFANNGPEFTVHTYKDKKGKYGRYIADVDILFDEDGNSLLTEQNVRDGTGITLSQHLIMSGLAVPM